MIFSIPNRKYINNHPSVFNFLEYVQNVIANSCRPQRANFPEKSLLPDDENTRTLKQPMNLNKHTRTHARYALNTWMTRTTYCRQIGHSDICLPQLVQVTMCPQSSKTQSIEASIQILQRSFSDMLPLCSVGKTVRIFEYSR